MRFNLTTLLCLAFGAIFTTNTLAADLSQQSSVDEVLDALDARGQGLEAFITDVKLAETDSATGDSSVRSGKVWYQAGNNPRIRVVFDKREANKKIIEDKIEYLLSGPDLIDRTYRTKTEVTRHVLKPGEKLNLLKLGEGPFPLPIGQKKEDVHSNFEVHKVEAKKDDPAQTVHILLSPKAETRFARRFVAIDVWVDLKDNMPRRIETLDSNQSTVRTTDLSRVQINPKLTDADFELPKVNATEWQLISEAFNG